MSRREFKTIHRLIVNNNNNIIVYKSLLVFCIIRIFMKKMKLVCLEIWKYSLNKNIILQK